MALLSWCLYRGNCFTSMSPPAIDCNFSVKIGSPPAIDCNFSVKIGSVSQTFCFKQSESPKRHGMPRNLLIFHKGVLSGTILCDI